MARRRSASANRSSHRGNATGSYLHSNGMVDEPEVTDARRLVQKATGIGVDAV